MKKRLLDWIVCPNCGERPRLQVFQEERVEIPSAVSAPACSFYCGRHDMAAPHAILPPPDCNACYREEILEALFSCSCGLAYPVIDGIPRLIRNAREEYPEFFARHGLAGEGAKPAPAVSAISAGGPAADRRSSRSFGRQWQIYREGDATWFKDDHGLRKREFLYNLQTTPEELSRSTVLDGGCGNGELTRSFAEYGPEVVAMDFSRSVEGARRRLFDKGFPVSHRVHYLQGNVLELPLLARSFDMIHSSGVLHHTPSTYRAFRSVSKAVKPGGKVYIQLYRRRPTWIHLVNVALRAVTTRMPMGFLYGLCYVATPVHSALSRLVHRLRGEAAPPRATARERAVQMFDNYSPRYQYRHTVPEIMDLFRSEGFEDLKDVTLDNEARHMLAVLGRKALTPAAGTAPQAARAAALTQQPA
ncbi:MAG TPA: methyltransferase domain-containing protein [Thermoanaerobaculia bacterium]|nr:methyltransferase domain-containing protein [Thermoanaerobaculia bacterium]